MTLPKLDLQSARILVVDDNPANVALLQAMLEEEGYGCVTGHTEPAAALHEATEAPPDLVLLDIRMPGMDGHEFMRRMVQQVKGFVPVIVLTAQTDAQTRVKALAGGAKDFLTKPFDHTEVLHRIRNTLETKLLYNQRRDQAAHLEELVGERTAELAHMATHDVTVALPNRAGTRLALTERVRRRQGLAMMIAVERLESVVEALGTAAAEESLRQVGQRLTAALTADGFVGYWGGTDFVALVPDLDPDDAAGRIARVFSVPFDVGDAEVVLDAKAGAARFPEDGEEADPLVQRAGMAMIMARRTGRDFGVFSPALEEAAAERHVLERELRHAVERDQLVLHYQPKVRLGDRAVVGVEALVRWQHPELGFVSPARFIPIAEETGAVVGIGRWVLEQACRDAVRWQEGGHPLEVAVNVSGRQFDALDLVQVIEGALTTAGLPAELLEVEITETALMRDLDRAKQVLHDIQDLGAHIAIDDFGTGYSSLGYLRQLPLNTLKVDQSFVRHLDRNADDRALTRTIVAMAGTLGLKAVAEGIETENHAEFLRSLECPLGQGYLFARPMPALDLEGWLSTCSRASVGAVVEA